MKTDYFSCKFCGIVIDVEMLKIIYPNDDETKVSALYCDYYDYELITCPSCKKLNQRRK